MTDERRIQEAIRELPVTAAEPGFRDRLRREFVSGTLETETNLQISEPTKRARRVIPMRVGALGLAVAAALAAFFFAWPRGPEWNLVAASGEGTVTVNGRAFPIERVEETLGSTLPPGSRIRVEGDAMLDLATPGVLAIQMAGGSTLEVPGRQGWWRGGGFAGAVTRGEVRFVTGDGFAGQTLVLVAPAATVRVTGTTFAVITDADTTCVCVLDGRVLMEDADGVGEVVEGGKRRTLYRKTGRAHEEPILPMERMKLEMLRERVTSEEAQ